MLTRRPKTAQEKREELKTYHELHLRRDLKSARQRRRVQAGGRLRVLGDGSDAQPFLTVPADRYRAVRLEAQRELLLEAKQAGLDLPVETLQQQLAPRMEALVYARLAHEADLAVGRRSPLAALGRRLTASEEIHFAASSAAGFGGKVLKRRLAQSTLDRVVGQIEERQIHNPARYQTAWAQVVGIDAAMQSHLERIDPATQTAFFRCINSVLSADLQRRVGLPQKLGRLLGIPLRRLRGQF
jgi:hypothetical protein